MIATNICPFCEQSFDKATGELVHYECDTICCIDKDGRITKIVRNCLPKKCPECNSEIAGTSGSTVKYTCGSQAVTKHDGGFSFHQECKEKVIGSISELLAKLRETRCTVQIRAPHDRHWHVSLHDPNTQEIVAVGVSSELTKACAECLQHYRRD